MQLLEKLKGFPRIFLIHLVLNISDLDFDDQEEENIFDNKELIFVQEMSKLPSSHLPKGINWHQYLPE